MSTMKIGTPHSSDMRVEGDPVLRQKAVPVPQSMIGTPELEAMLTKMKKALRDEPFGVAIAAPQVGISYRIFIVRGYVYENMRRSDPGANDLADVVFINPDITYRSEKKDTIEGEGCLSVPNVYGTIERSARVRIVAQDEKGKKMLRNGSGFIAEIYEHETDHLDGILFIDKARDLHEGRDE